MRRNGVECVSRGLSETMEKELYNNCLKSDSKKEKLKGKRRIVCLYLKLTCL